MENLSPTKDEEDDDKEEDDDHKPVLLLKKSSSQVRKPTKPEPVEESDDEDEEDQEAATETKNIKETAFFKESPQEEKASPAKAPQVKNEIPKTESDLMIGHLSDLNKHIYKCISDLQLEKIT